MEPGLNDRSCRCQCTHMPMSGRLVGLSDTKSLMPNHTYSEGDWFAVPLRDDGFALGIVARANPEGRCLGTSSDHVGRSNRAWPMPPA
jgi:hypothetical protein